jgi:hypothetical protein
MSRPDKDQPSTLGFGRDWVWVFPSCYPSSWWQSVCGFDSASQNPRYRIAEFHEVPKTGRHSFRESL